MTEQPVAASHEGMPGEMPESIIVEVIQADIDKGVPREGDNCPVFHALERTGWEVVAVESSEVELLDKNNRFWAYLPSAGGTDWIEMYDYGLEMPPVTFTLERDDDKMPSRVS